MAQELRHLTPAPRLITPRELSAAIEANEPHIKLLDASWHMPNSGRSALAEFRTGPRLPHARFFDHDAVADTTKGLAHMRPDVDRFRARMAELGISVTDPVTIYDSVGIFSAPRAAWLLHSFGRPSIAVLDGGMPRWIAEGFKTEKGPPEEISLTEYQLVEGLKENGQDEAVASYADTNANVADPRSEILDARPRPRFEGIAPEPKPGLPSGHIPGSLSLPFNELLTDGKAEGYRTFLKPDQLEAVLVSTFGSTERWEAIKTRRKALVASCGSGMTACIMWLAVQICVGNRVGSGSEGNRPQVKIYDESWTGYAGRKGSPIETYHKN